MKFKWLTVILPVTLILRAYGGTPPPALYSPVADETVSSAGLPVIYSLPATPQSGSVHLQFFNAGTNVILVLNNSISNNFVLNPSNLAGATEIVSNSAPALADGVYSVLLGYQDALGDPSSSTQATNVAIKTSTATPVLLSPLTGTTNNILPIQYLLPDAPLPNSVQVVFYNVSTNVTLFLNNNSSNNFAANPRHLAGPVEIISSSASIIPDGVYSVLLSYQDYLGNPAATAQINNFDVKTATARPMMMSPANGVTNIVLPIQYVLPDAPLAGSVQILFFNLSNNATLFLNNSTSNNFAVNPANLGGSAMVWSNTAPSLPDGRYIVLLSYQDFLGNAAASVQASGFTVKTATKSPVLVQPASGAANRVVPVQYSLTDSPLAGSVQLLFHNSSTNVTLFLNNNSSNYFIANPGNLGATNQIVSATSPVLPDGVYSAQLSYQDYLGNPAASAQSANVIVKTTTTPPVLQLPADNAASQMLPIRYFLPDTALTGSVHLVLYNPGFSYTLALNNSPANNFVASPTNLAASAQITSSSSPSLRTGVYTVVLSYQDYLGNPAASAQATNYLVQFNPVYFLPGGINFSNGCIVLTATNLADFFNDGTYNILFSPSMNTPLSNWTDLGPATGAVDVGSGYQFQIPANPGTNSAGFYIFRGN